MAPFFKIFCRMVLSGQLVFFYIVFLSCFPAKRKRVLFAVFMVLDAFFA